jgi:hypothetical protein
MEKNEVLVGLVPEIGVAFATDVNAAPQDIEVVATIDNKNNPDKPNDWQGYMCLFNDTSAGEPKKVLVSAGRLLRAALDAGRKDVFTEEGDGLKLSCFHFGIEGGNPIFK